MTDDRYAVTVTSVMRATKKPPGFEAGRLEDN